MPCIFSIFICFNHINCRFCCLGQYGEVHLCQMTALKDGGGLDKPRLVAMKKLQPAASEATKIDFIREIKIMSKLRHPNIVQVS